MQLSKSFLSRPPSTRTSSGSTAPRANIPRFAIDPQMEIAAESDADRIERVNLACIQCRARHVKCDASQPVCNRCKRDRKECIYKNTGTAELRLQQEAERTQKEQDGTLSEQSVNDAQGHQPNIIPSLLDESALPESSVDLSDSLLIPNIETQYPNSDLAFHVDSDRLLELYFENFWPSLPIILPLHHLQWRRSNDGHGMETLLLLLQYIGAVYAPWIKLGPGPYKKTAIQALKSPFFAHTPFNVQALLLFAIAEYHSDCKPEGQGQLNLAVKIALELHMNQQAFAQVYGEGSPVLEESWRRTYYFLAIADQNFAVFSNTPIYTLANVSNTVDLPCDDEHFNSGLIPPVMSLHGHEDRELAELEIVFSSIAYFYDLHLIVKSVMDIVQKGSIAKSQSTVAQIPDSTLETDVPRDDLIFPVNPSAQIDIFSGLTLPIDWETTNCSYASSGHFGIS
ncbi:hypothetical protein HBI23_176870 [Parastagonospora nodorum]|nr:hypothetical protein HBH49_164030 [Parastagonospora nodorum]KAH5648945.1 hypothetical protein HBI23_176870 [Parastagonospora nodorum]